MPESRNFRAEVVVSTEIGIRYSVIGRIQTPVDQRRKQDGGERVEIKSEIFFQQLSNDLRQQLNFYV